MTLEPTRLSDAPGGSGYGEADTAAGVVADGRHYLGGAVEVPRTLVWEAFIGNASRSGGVVQEDDATGNEYMSDGGAGTAIATTEASFTVVASGAGGPAADVHRWRGERPLRWHGAAAQLRVRLRAREPASVAVTTGAAAVPVAAGRRDRVASCGAAAAAAAAAAAVAGRLPRRVVVVGRCHHDGACAH